MSNFLRESLYRSIWTITVEWMKDDEGEDGEAATYLDMETLHIYYIINTDTQIDVLIELLSSICCYLQYY